MGVLFTFVVLDIRSKQCGGCKMVEPIKLYLLPKLIKVMKVEIDRPTWSQGHIFISQKKVVLCVRHIFL